jgi:Fe-S-cluster-containing dehydrogenase component
MEGGEIVARHGMIIDLTRCNGCYNCQIACKDEHVGNDLSPLSKAQPAEGHFWMRIEENERGQFPRVLMTYIPIPCLHCQHEAPCMAADRSGVIRRRSDGIVLIDPEKATGKKELVDTCPFGTIFWNEEVNLPQKCTLCAHLLDLGWREPRCVEACPTEALLFGDLDDPNSQISQKKSEIQTEVFQGRKDLNPIVVYVGLPRPFLAGTVALGDIDECANGAAVILTDKTTGATLETETDGFGDFQFNGLPQGRSYALSVSLEGYLPQDTSIDIKQDTTLEEIILKRPRDQ